MSRTGPAGPPGRTPGALRKAVTTAVRVDTSAVSFGIALRATVGCVVVLVVALATVGDAGAAAATVGALLAAIPSIASTARRPLATMAATTCGIALSTFVGSASANVAWLHLVMLALWGFGGGLLVALGDTGSIVGTQAAMAFIVFGRFAQPTAGAAKLVGYIALGGAFQILLAAATRWPVALLAQRGSLADAYHHLSRLALGGPEYSSLPAGLALDAAEASLASPTLVRRIDVSILRSLVDEGRRMRIELASLEALQLHFRRVAEIDREVVDVAVDRALVQAAFILEGIAQAIKSGGDVQTASLDLALREVATAAAASASESARASVALGVEGAAIAVALLDRVMALGGQLRAAAALATETAVGPRPVAGVQTRRLARSAVDRVWSQLLMVQANLSLRSTALRHAVRLAVVVPIAEIVSTHTPLQRGYWVPLTAALVLRPDFGGTLSRGFARLAGTIVGVGITGVIVAGGHLRGAPIVVLVGLLALGAFATFGASYALYTAFLTGLVVLLVNLATPGAHATLTTALDRLVDTIVGGALALVVYVAWPTWTTDEARQSLAELVSAERAYLDAVLGALSGRAPLGEAEARTLARRLRLSRANCEAVVTRSLAEPHARRVDGPLAAGMLAGLRRLSLTTHLLRSILATTKEIEPRPELEPLHRGLDEALAAIGTALAGRTPAVLPPLRRLHSDMAGELRQRGGTALLIVETDELVDAVDTLAVLVGTGPVEGD
ncbi:MAG: hypothetical protein JWO62_148 [Acidimicrobiaceae bacterium]|nr:hypothetical protein [Acidimicrobiaceae bacterium]